AEDLFKNISEVCRCEAPWSSCTTCCPLHARMTKAIIPRAFLVIREDFVGLIDFFELLRRIGRFVHVGMILPSQLVVGFFDIVTGGIACHDENVIVVACHRIQECSSLVINRGKGMQASASLTYHTLRLRLSKFCVDDIFVGFLSSSTRSAICRALLIQT